MDTYPLDYAFGAALLTLLAIAAVWIAGAVKGWRRIPRESWEARRNGGWPSTQHRSYFMPSRRWPTE